MPSPDELSAALKVISDCAGSPDLFNDLPLGKRKALTKRLEAAGSNLSALLEHADPVELPREFFDPSDPSTIGKLIAGHLVNQPREQLSSLNRFYGAGVYAIYYVGDFSVYEPVKHSETPLYIGKADPKNKDATTPKDQGTPLFGRLQEHRKSILAASNLELEDFECRRLVVKSAWQATAESYLIHRYKPVWNKETNICFGFGKHGDSSMTRKNRRSLWDTLHPGRKWASNQITVEAKQDATKIKEMIAEHYRTLPPVPQPQQTPATPPTR